MGTTKKRLLLYGAYGYTGRLTAELAAAKNIDLILAGRNRQALQALGDRLKLQTRVVRLDEPSQLSEALADVTCVLHMAGPFAVTSMPMLDSCLATRTSYIDITGEIEVFEAIWALKEEIRRAGITVLPGAGFDVVPSDCLAGYVGGKVESIVSLVLALRGLDGASQGTLRTAIRQISKPTLCRRKGAIVALTDRSIRSINFGCGDEPCVPVSWGDVSTAFYSTGASDITVYFRRTRLLHLAGIAGKVLGSFFRSPLGQRGLAAIVRKFPEGPDQRQRSSGRSMISAEATGASRDSCRAILTTPNAYDFTANSTLEIASRISRLQDPLGLVTPFQAFGADFVPSLPGCTRTDIHSTPMSRSIEPEIAALRTALREGWAFED
jgi:short subunit dehydrogenase-like uncharacterized protein